MAEDRMLSDEILLGIINSKSGGGGGTSDYSQLTNKPQINSVELSGNKSLSDLGIASATALGTVSNAVTAIKDGTNIDSFGDVETALVDKADKSSVKTEFIGTTAEWNALTAEQKKTYDTYQITDDYTEGSGGFTFSNFTGITSAYGVLSPSQSISAEDNFIIGAYGNGSYVVTPFVASSDNTWRFMVLQSDTMRPLAEQSATVNYVLVIR